MADRFLVFSDLHLNTWSYGASVSSGWNSRLEEQAHAMGDMGAYAAARNIKYAFFCGDFFHTPGRLSTEVLNAGFHVMTMLCNTYGLKTYWLVGNHDQASRSGHIHSLRIAEAYGHLLEDACPISIPGFPPVIGRNYSESCHDLETFLTKTPDEALIFLHQGVSGVEVNSKGFTLNEILKPEMIPSKATHAFAGHYHSYKRVTDNLTIPGAPMQHNWSDVGDSRGFLDVLLEGHSIHLNHVELNTSKFIKRRYEDLTTEEIFEGDFLKIVDVPDQGIAEDLRRRFPKECLRSLEVEVKREEKNVESIGEHESIEDLFESFVVHKGIKGRDLEIGREIMKEKYSLPNEIITSKSK